MNNDLTIPVPGELPVVAHGISVKTALDKANIGLAMLDAQGKVCEVNHSLALMSGENDSELIGKTFTDLVLAEDQHLHNSAFSQLISTDPEGSTLEIRLKNNNGEFRWVRNTYSLAGQPDSCNACCMVVCVDITGEKQAQQKAEEITKRFRFLADGMPQQIWTATADGRLNYFSHAFYDYSGLTPDDIRTGSWSKIVYKDDQERTRSLWKQALTSGDEFVVEHRLRSKDGQFVWQLSRAIAQKDPAGKIILWVGTTSNIHRQKTVEEELEKQVAERTHDLQQANFSLKHSNHDLEQFAFIATHDLQEPLRKIRTYSNLVNKRYLEQLPEDAQDYMLKIESASERMSVLIDDLLNYSLLLRPQEEFEETDLDQVLEQVIAEFEPLISSKQAVIEEDPLPSIEAIRVQVYQLFSSLLSNALKFTEDGKLPVISIRARILPEEEVLQKKLNMDLTYLEIVFKDDGIGFLQEFAQRIFSIFQRLNNRKKYPGTGIGLAMCQKIVTYHHGLIYATAEEHRGASFFVLLPLAQSE